MSLDNEEAGASALAGRVVDAARKRAAAETYARHETTLRRTAQRYSLCAADADDALQRGLEILLLKAPSEDPRELIRWMQTVVKHEALAVRRDRERILSGPAATRYEDDRDDWVASLPAQSDGPPERAERREAVARSREALQALKPQELRALTLLAEGYSYKEIGEITNFSHTKINRCLAEGRERYRRLLSRGEDGGRCEDLRPLLSAFCDGETSTEETATLREHLRACAGCRSTLRAYRAAPGAAAALAPALPLSRSLLDRAHDAFASLSARFGGGGAADSALSQVAASGGTRGAGMAALAKALAVCAGAAGGAAACVATGVVPTPLVPENPVEKKPPVLERKLDSRLTAEWSEEPSVEYEPAPAPSKQESGPAEEPEQAPAVEPIAGPEVAAPSGAVEYAPPEPAAAPAATGGGETGGGNAAGEFGP